MNRVGESRNDEANRIGQQDDARIRAKYNLPVMVGAYCPVCHLFNFLICKDKDGQSICAGCKENE
ncbi:MAG: hypothetical protein MUO31_13225 [Thermodesulfovibrionales bacterium]|nr:hypothetical protein [Thermodesulfovibrionales bacterium]